MRLTIYFLLFLSFFSAQAHSIWVETESVAKMNKPHQIKVFFGEPNDVTPTAKWFSDLKDFSLTLTTPSGKTISLTDKKQETDFYSLSFIPTENGVYTINLHHIVKDVFKKMKITYQSGALVTTDKNNSEIKTVGVMPLQVENQALTLQKDKERKLTLLMQGEKKKGEKLVITAPNSWQKTLYSNIEGGVKFTPLWKGKYHLSYSYSKNEPGNHNGTPYEVDYQVITLKLNAN